MTPEQRLFILSHSDHDVRQWGIRNLHWLERFPVPSEQAPAAVVQRMLCEVEAIPDMIQANDEMRSRLEQMTDLIHTLIDKSPRDADGNCLYCETDVNPRLARHYAEFDHKADCPIKISQQLL